MKKDSKMGEYILKGDSEVHRLDEQSDLFQFSVETELKGIEFSKYPKILDAGCGSGVLCRYIESHGHKSISGCDLNEESLVHAKNSSKTLETNFFKHNIVEDKFKEKYDLIFNRLVAHHLGEEMYSKALNNFYDGLNDGGRVVIVDPDGLLFNLLGFNAELDKTINTLTDNFQGDLLIARKIPRLLEKAGFKNISWRIETMDFQGVEKEKEIDQWNRRFQASLSFYTAVLGSEFKGRKFIKDYIDELSKPNTPIFYHKFIITAYK